MNWYPSRKINGASKKESWPKKSKNKSKVSFYAVERMFNPEKVKARWDRYRINKKNATPKWLTSEHLNEMKALRQQAREISIKTGVPHEIDHIEPLYGYCSCGLNVPWNLRIVTRKENQQKSRKLLL